MLLSSRRHAFLFEKCCSRLDASDICFLKMRLALTRATSRTQISVLSRREHFFFKKHASRLHESNIRKTNVAPVDAIRIFIWKILLSSRRYALFYLTPERFLLKMSVERQSCALSTDTLFYNDVLAKTQRKSLQKSKTNLKEPRPRRATRSPFS